jgi:hypothetical protein
MAMGPMWHWRSGFGKGRATPVVLMGIDPQCPVQGGFPLFCRGNAAVLNLADACLSPNQAPMRLFYGHEAVHAGPGRCVIVFTVGRSGVDGQMSPDPSELARTRG